MPTRSTFATPANDESSAIRFVSVPHDPLSALAERYDASADLYRRDSVDTADDPVTAVDEGDGAGLTSNMVWSQRYDVESGAPFSLSTAPAPTTGFAPRPRHLRAPSSGGRPVPIGGAGVSRRRSLLESAARGIRRMSVRVVNLGGRDITADDPTHSGLTGPHVRLPDDDDPVQPLGEPVQSHADPSDEGPPDPLAGLLRGKSLGVFGPTHPVRRAALAALMWTWTEPVVLALILAYVVIVCVQSSASVFTSPRPSTPGYFFQWEDWAIFVLMILFTCVLSRRPD